MSKIFTLLFFVACLFVNGQHQDKLNFIHADVVIEPLVLEKKIQGKVTYDFKVLAEVDSIFLDAIGMELSSIRLNKKKVKFEYNGNRILIKKKLQKDKSYDLLIEFIAQPKQTVYFLGWDDVIEGNEQIWTQGQGKYTSHWLPSFDDMEEKVEFDLSIIFDENYEVISNGKLTAKSNKEPKSIMWSYDMQEAMSSYLLAFVIGKYKKQEIRSEGGITIENYYYPQDSLKVEPTYRYTKKIFDFIEEEIGVAYPWQNYKQIPVRDFLYAGMENTTATIFSDGYVIDSTAFLDKNYVNVNAHELAHQWFGNFVTEKDSNHHWLHEGFATYYAYLAEKEIFGEDHYYWKLFNSLNALQKLEKQGQGQSLLDPKASSLTFYEKGAWALFMLRSKVGNAFFKAGIKSYLNKYQFKNVKVQDFLEEMKKVSGADLSAYKESWLVDSTLPYIEARNVLLNHSASLRLAADFDAEFKSAHSNTVNYKKFWNADKSIHLKKHIIEKYRKQSPLALIKDGFASDTLAIRQSLAVSIDSIPLEIKANFESLLDDESYVTLENALIKLWVSFPEERVKYLDHTKNTVGLQNKNIRLLWLTLALLTNGYDGPNTQNYFQELSGYTSSNFGWETRITAFQYLMESMGLNNESLKSLFQASDHHSWQFKKYARNLLDELLQDEDYKSRIELLAKELKGAELRYINTKLNQE